MKLNIQTEGDALARIEVLVKRYPILAKHAYEPLDYGLKPSVVWRRLEAMMAFPPYRHLFLRAVA